MSIPELVSKTISPATNNALSLVTDPYHDYNLRATGYPDGLTTISAIKTYKERVSIICPFILGPGDTWYFHVHTTPLHASANMEDVHIQGNTIAFDGLPGSRQYLGPVNISYFRLNAGSVVEKRIVPLGQDVSLLPHRKTQRRTVSLGFEIHNTSAELYKSGSLTIYRTPVVDSSVDLWLSNNSTPSPSYVPYHSNMIASLPGSISQANLMPNSRTWEASRGAYCVALPSPNNTMSNTYCNNMILTIDGTTYALHGTGDVASVKSNATYSPLANVGVYSSQYSDTNQTFMLDIRQILELIPSPEDVVNMQYASSAPKEDTSFLKLYRAMFNQIPPGVYVAKNASGDWFRHIISIAKQYIPAVLAASPHPAVQALSVPTAGVLQFLDGRFATKKQLANTQVPGPSNQQTKTKTTTKNQNKARRAKHRATGQVVLARLLQSSKGSKK